MAYLFRARSLRIHIREGDRSLDVSNVNKLECNTIMPECLSTICINTYRYAYNHAKRCAQIVQKLPSLRNNKGLFFVIRTAGNLSSSTPIYCCVGECVCAWNICDLWIAFWKWWTFFLAVLFLSIELKFFEFFFKSKFFFVYRISALKHKSRNICVYVLILTDRNRF